MQSDGQSDPAPLIIGGALALTAALSVGLASVLGWDLVGDDDNRGLGRPLSVQENARLVQAQQSRADGGDADPCQVGSVCKGEDLAEEQAIINLYTGVGIRAK